MASKPPAKKAAAPKKAQAQTKAPAKAVKKPAKGLTIQQRLFVAEYLKDRNGTQAAIRAGYSEKTARAIASELLTKPDIQAAINAFVVKVEEKAGITAERVLQELARLAFFDPRKLFKDDGTPKPITELDDDTAAAIAGLDVVEEYEGTGKDRVFVGYTKKYKVTDKNAALDKAMKHLGLFKVDNEQKANPLTELLQNLSGKSALPIVK